MKRGKSVFLSEEFVGMASIISEALELTLADVAQAAILQMFAEGQPGSGINPTRQFLDAYGDEHLQLQMLLGYILGTKCAVSVGLSDGGLQYPTILTTRDEQYAIPAGNELAGTLIIMLIKNGWECKTQTRSFYNYTVDGGVSYDEG